MKKRSIMAVLTFVMFFSIIAFTKAEVVRAEGTLTVVDVDYESETITFKTTKGDQKLFFANKATATTWDVAYGNFNANEITMDISWASKTSNVTFYVKGDVSTTPVKVVLPKQPTAFKAGYDIASNKVHFSNLGKGVTSVYWRKANTDLWHSLRIDDETFAYELERFSLQGITLYFRTEQIRGKSLDDMGVRPSKESSLKITKRANAPSVKADYSKLTINAKNTMEYKVSTDDSWRSVKGTFLSFADVDENLIYSESNDTIEEVSVDIRTKATSSKVASKSTTIVLKGQENTEKENIIPEYTGSEQLTITIGDDKENELEGASTSNPYEYAIKKPDDKSFKIEDASWTSITSKSPVAISKTKAPTGSSIYVRKKATSDKPAAAYVTIEVGEYPSGANINGDIELKKISGEDKDFPFVIEVPHKDNKISSITFGDKAVKYNVSKTEEVTKGMNIPESDKRYQMTVTITDTSAVEAVPANIDEELTGKITLDNGDVIDKNITLYIYPAATVKGDNVIIFKDVEYEEDLKLELDLGHKTKEEVTVESVKINNKEIDFSQKNGTGEYIKEVTIGKEALNQYAKDEVNISQLGEVYPISVELSNGEIIKSKVTVTVKLIASVTSDTTGIVISISTYDKNKYERENAGTDKDGKPIVIDKVYKDPEITLTIDKDLYAKDKSYYIQSINWNNKSIISMGEINNQVMKITLDVDKIVDAGLGNGPVVIELASRDHPDKKVVIDSAYTITVVD